MQVNEAYSSSGNVGYFIYLLLGLWCAKCKWMEINKKISRKCYRPDVVYIGFAFTWDSNILNLVKMYRDDFKA